MSDFDDEDLEGGQPFDLSDDEHEDGTLPDELEEEDPLTGLVPGMHIEDEETEDEDGFPGGSPLF
jgi:hypothetical protein